MKEHPGFGENRGFFAYFEKVDATVKDITENKKNLKIKNDVAPEMTAKAYEANEADAVFINVNYAIQNKLNPKTDSIELESPKEKENKDYDLVNVGAVHLEPFGIYSKKYKSLKDLPDGAKIIMSNNAAEQGRMLAMLENAGLIKLKSGNSKVITVGATPTPHAEILEEAKPLLKEKGYELKIKNFTDYKLINKALATKDLDANYFQHVPYLEQEMILY
ncbi:hypothetical protein DT075_11500 [Bacillus licheniformis]|nr:hypothetical protein DT075_11500 [Bacillus licheniformis]